MNSLCLRMSDFSSLQSEVATDVAVALSRDVVRFLTGTAANSPSCAVQCCATGRTFQ